MKTLLELTRLTELYLKEKGVPSPRLESEWLVAETLKIDRLTIYADFNRPITELEQKHLRDALTRRGKREPLQYILGEVSFLNCRLKVNSNVLIPRPETEILADKIIQSIDPKCSGTLWDICCGSGALGIALKKARPNLNVVLSDLSTKALKIARENAQLNEVAVTFLEGDLLEPFKGLKADFVVSNPPYVTEDEFKNLEPEVKCYEPKEALVSGATGDEFYQRFAVGLPSYLNEGARVWMELGPKDSEKYFKDLQWKSVLTELDLSGTPRYLMLVQNDS